MGERPPFSHSRALPSCPQLLKAGRRSGQPAAPSAGGGGGGIGGGGLKLVAAGGPRERAQTTTQMLAGVESLRTQRLSSLKTLSGTPSPRR